MLVVWGRGAGRTTHRTNQNPSRAVSREGGKNLVREILGEGDSCRDVMEERAELHGTRYAGEGRCMADWTVSMQRWSPHMLVFWVV